MAKARTPRRAWIDAGLRALGAGGPEAVRIEPLAQSLGVTKGGFYGYFADRQALLEEMLDSWERDVTEVVIDRVEKAARGQDARAKLRSLFAVVTEIDGDQATGLLPIDLAIRDWARRDPAVNERQRRIDNRQADYLRSLFSEFCPDPVDVEARCLATMAMRLGAHLVPIDHSGHTRAEVARRMFLHQLS